MPIAGRIRSKLATWKASLLSISGRVQLVRSEVQSILIYSFMVYAWPVSLIKMIDKWLRNFIWSSNIDAKKVCTVSWFKICSPVNGGGLGVRSIKDINKAAVLKLYWELVTSNSQWVNLIKSRVFIKNDVPVP